jgi:hypothetical protein
MLLSEVALPVQKKHFKSKIMHSKKAIKAKNKTEATE